MQVICSQSALHQDVQVNVGSMSSHTQVYANKHCTSNAGSILLGHKTS